ncbi:hypothetical protein AAVH_40955, partial [Aphelenchoides avenae]
ASWSATTIQPTIINTNASVSDSGSVWARTLASTQRASFTMEHRSTSATRSATNRRAAIRTAQDNRTVRQRRRPASSWSRTTTTQGDAGMTDTTRGSVPRFARRKSN